MYEVRLLDAGLELFIRLNVPIWDPMWVAHAYVDGNSISGKRGLTQDELKVLTLLTDVPPGNLCRYEKILTDVWGRGLEPENLQMLRNAVFSVRDIGFKNLDKEDREQVIQVLRSQGYTYKGTISTGKRDSLPYTSDTRPRASIAVLPFANMSADKENEYFSDGLAEEILNLLAKIPSLKVTARTSAFAFKGKSEDIRKISETLGVRNVLQGSVRRSGHRVRVTAQLINTDDASQLWSERYDRELNDIFAIQDEISQAISEALQVRLAPRAQTVNIEAYQNYLKGQYYRVRLTPESLTKAKEFFEKALAVDPNYAPAHSGLALYYYTLALLCIKPSIDVALLAKSAAEKALAIDPANSDAHSVLATMAAIVDYDWRSAEKHHRAAMVTEPVPPLVRFRYAVYYLLPLRRVHEAIEQSRLALYTDPLSMLLHFGMAWSMCKTKQYRETIEYVHRATELDMDFFLIWFPMGLAQLDAGFLSEAIATFRRLVDLAPWWQIGVGALAAALRQSGDHAGSQEWSRKLGESDAAGAAFYYAAAGDADAMFEALDLAHRQRDRVLVDIQSLPFFDPYLADPRFQTMLQRMHLSLELQ
jgi:TolB-like protein/Tfp pilus assembly protein PilF